MSAFLSILIFGILIALLEVFYWYRRNKKVKNYFENVGDAQRSEEARVRAIIESELNTLPIEDE